MSLGRDSHLSRGQLLKAIVDGADLAADGREHLRDCRRCRSEKSGIERELRQLSRAAKQHVPVLRRKPVILPEQRISPGWTGRRLPSMGIAAAALALALFLWGGLPPGRESAPIVDTGLESPATASLVTEVYTLMENVLPQTYLEICAESELYFSDGFVEYVVPLEENEPLSTNHQAKGARLC